MLNTAECTSACQHLPELPILQPILACELGAMVGKCGCVQWCEAVIFGFINSMLFCVEFILCDIHCIHFVLVYLSDGLDLYVCMVFCILVF